MRKRSDIHTFEDESFLKSMTHMSAVVCAVGFALAVALGIALDWWAPGFLDARLRALFGGDGFMDSLIWTAWALAAVMVSLAAHELVHGVFFKLFAPAGARVTFGANWKRGMLYACAEGVVYTRRQYLVIALAPSVVVTAAVVVAGVACACPVAGVLAATVHLSGCTGDWAYVRAICADPLITHCEDTSYGVCFFGPNDAAEPTGAGAPVSAGASGGAGAPGGADAAAEPEPFACGEASQEEGCAS